MLKLMRGEFYRLLHKKSMYLYFGMLAVVMIAVFLIYKLFARGDEQ